MRFLLRRLGAPKGVYRTADLLLSLDDFGESIDELPPSRCHDARENEVPVLVDPARDELNFTDDWERHAVVLAETKAGIAAGLTPTAAVKRGHMVAWLSLGRCVSCGYRIDNLKCASDDCTVCPECGSAWNLAPVGRGLTSDASGTRRFVRSQPLSLILVLWVIAIIVANATHPPTVYAIAIGASVLYLLYARKDIFSERR